MARTLYPISGFSLMGEKGEALHTLYYEMRSKEHTSFIELFQALVVEGAKKRGMKEPKVLQESA